MQVEVTFLLRIKDRFSVHALLLCTQGHLKGLNHMNLNGSILQNHLLVLLIYFTDLYNVCVSAMVRKKKWFNLTQVDTPTNTHINEPFDLTKSLSNHMKNVCWC